MFSIIVNIHAHQLDTDRNQHIDSERFFLRFLAKRARKKHWAEASASVPDSKSNEWVNG